MLQRIKDGIFWVAVSTVGILLAVASYLNRRLEKSTLRAEKAEEETKQNNEVINRAKRAKEIAHDAYRLDADDIDDRLQQDYRD